MESGRTRKYSLALPRDIAEAARARGGPSGLSAYAAAAVARQIERDDLNELITAAEAEHGPTTEGKIRTRHDQLHRARQSPSSGGAEPS